MQQFQSHATLSIVTDDEDSAPTETTVFYNILYKNILGSVCVAKLILSHFSSGVEETSRVDQNTTVVFQRSFCFGKKIIKRK